MRVVNEQTNMRSPELEPVIHLMSAYPARWAVCGGWAIDLFLNRVTRHHKDVDIMMLWCDQALVHDYLEGWTLEVAHDGKLQPWQRGEVLEPPRNTLWCKNPTFQPDFFEILFDEVDDQHFYFRRNRSIKLELEQAFLTSPNGVPIIAPEIALLYKSKNPAHEGNASDFRNALPHLNRTQLAWLKQALTIEYEAHEWLMAIESMAS